MNARSPAWVEARVWRAVAAVTLTVLVAACALPAPQERSEECMTPPPHAAGVLIYVLNDVSASDDGESLDAERQQAFDRILDVGFAMRAILMLDVIGAGVGDSQLVSTRLMGEGPNELFREDDRECRKAAIVQAFADVLEERVEGTDILSALRAAGSRIAGFRVDTVYLVMLSDMINTRPPVDMTGAQAFEEGVEPIVDAAAELLGSCSGWNVYAVGPGKSDAGGPELDRHLQVEQFWRGLFSGCGGRIAVYDSQLGHFPVYV